MPGPDFSKTVVTTLAKRARFQCSNPDCCVHTVGPNSDPMKSTTVGEAAHILGASPGSARYDASMSDFTRSAITNGIWLCRNCHIHVDKDPSKFTAELLFTWRTKHEELVCHELGTRGDRIRYAIEMAEWEYLSKYPSIVQRIVIDRPRGWEWRFVAELMRFLNKPQLKRLNNLQAGHYYFPGQSISSEQFIDWIQQQLHVMANIIDPITGLFERLTRSWGEPGGPGDVEEMHDVCVLIRDALKVIVDFEETLRFAMIPEEGEPLRSILMNVVGNNAARLSKIPEKLDEVVALLETDHGGTTESPHVVEWTLVFDLPQDFSGLFASALEKYRQSFL
jgi:hypothetical protein